MIVVDANIVSFFLIEGERTAAANALRDADSEWMLPPFWRVEFQSILWKYVRFGGMPTEKALHLLDQAIGMFSINEVAPGPDVVLRDALNWKITVYDAQYASLARQMGIRLVTEDGPVQKACPYVALSLEDVLGRVVLRGTVREERTTYRTRERKGRA
jgi:predicted nucleic acid-binding protein